MAQVTLKNLRKDYGPLTVVHGINLDIKEHEFVVLVGPSGCGKSTTLRMIAGLEEITDGEIFISNEKMNNVSPSKRRVAMVFQDYALYPHMTVFENLAFSLRLKKVNKDEINARVHEAADMLDLTPYLKRKPSALSGGQRQRVAMGKAIVKRSDVFLFDEPLSNLDAKLRSKMRGEIKKFHNKTKITSVYVTHDQLEAMTLADRLVVLNNGRIEQVGSPIHVYETPKTVFVATFIGSPGMNMFNATIEEKYECFYITEEHGIFSFRLPDTKSKYLHDGMKVIMGIRPSDIFISYENDATPFDWRTKGTVQMAELLGKNAFITLEIDGQEFLGEVTGKEVPVLDQEVDLSFNLSYIHLFNAETKVNLLHEHDPELL